MQLKENKLKKMLAEGKTTYGTCIISNSPNLVELAGFCGFDWCRIDNEHNWRQDDSMENMLRAAVIGDITPIVRVDKDDPFIIRKVFEIGAQGIIIPDIRTPEEVKAVVKAAKFPPLGQRGFSGLCLSGGYGTVPAQEWIQWSNSQLMVGVMIETHEAVSCIDEIMSIDGLDFVLFGPADYSVSIGLSGPDKNNPQVQDAIKRTTESAAKYGKHVMIGINAPWEEEAQKYIDLGVSLIEVGHDYSVLAKSWKSALEQAKK